MGKFWRCLKFLPVVVFLAVPFAISVTYSLALIHNHIIPLLPYVSDTGALPPESCFFTFFFSTLSFIIVCAAYVRYREVLELVRLKPTIKIKPACNTAAFSVAIFSAVGLNIVASFQQSHLLHIHLAGALMCFFGGTAYFVFQTIFTARIYTKRKCLLCVRTLLTIVNIICTVSTFAPLYFATKDFRGDNARKWLRRDGGYELHLLSTFSEWFLIFSFAAYLFTLFWDFKKFDMDPPPIKFKNLNQTLEGNEPNKGQSRASAESRPSAESRARAESRA